MRANVLPFLKPLGIIDDDGRTTEQAKLWRDDGHYLEICKAIATKVYPKELIDAVPNPRDSRDAAKRWFANHTGSGDSACSRMAALYTVLIEADLATQPEGKNTKPKERTQKKIAKVSAPSRAVQSTPSVATPQAASTTPAPVTRNEGPDVSINLQIHISADASPDQIEQLFAAMAKHIYKRG